jgi:hypothetical protein
MALDAWRYSRTPITPIDLPFKYVFASSSCCMNRAYFSHLLLERQAPGHVTTLMQDTLSDIISLQFNKHSD